MLCNINNLTATLKCLGFEVKGDRNESLENRTKATFMHKHQTIVFMACLGLSNKILWPKVQSAERKKIIIAAANSNQQCPAGCLGMSGA